MISRLPQVRTTPDTLYLQGGLDLISPPGMAKPGTCRFALNYEQEFGGGYRRVGGIERFDGRFRPHEASYAVLGVSGGLTDIAVGDAVDGSISGASGTVCWVTTDMVAITAITGGPFVIGDHLMEGAVDAGTVTDDEPVVDGFVDNEISYGAAEIYRALISAPAGSGPVRGVFILNSNVYCFRDSAGESKIYKATAGGWTEVPLFSQVSFDGGSSAYTEGSVLSQGGATATVKRVVLESGEWGAGTAAGRLIIDPIAGTFAAGAAAGGGACNLLGAASQITRTAGGRVDAVVYNFTASTATRRLYGCDGTNAEFEFDGEVYVPISTGMGAVRASHVACFRNHLFYLYVGELQHSGIGQPYKWAPVFGAAALGTGGVGTGLVTVSGSESSAALMVMCRDAVWVLYGTSALDWNFQQIAEEAGAQAGSVQALPGGPMSFDTDTFRQFSPTQSFGNFSFESASRKVDPLLRGATPKCSVLVKGRSMYRCFFSDGLFVTATFNGKEWAWMPLDYGIVIECAVGGEINGQYRVFYGGADGMVYEADVGRSFDGGEIEAGIRLSSNANGGMSVIKQYRHVEVKSETESAFELAVGAEFSDSDPEAAGVSTESMTNYRRVYGAGLFWDFASWDRAYWDVALANKVRYPIHGQGESVSLLVRSLSMYELPHTLKLITIFFTPRRLSR